MFDRDKLTAQDYQDLNKAISKASPYVRFWYSLPNAWQFSINKNSIVEQTGAITDYDKLHEENRFMEKNEYNSRKIHLAARRDGRFNLGKLIGLKEIDICVYNPQNPVPEVKIGRRLAQLVQIDGFSWGNTRESRINFEKGFAIFNEEDQDIAHRLGLIYSPSGVLEIDSLTCSDFEMHKNKPKRDDSGNTMLYCDNRACKRRVRNPVLVVDKKSGGLYHSEICFWKDMRVKKYLSQERKDLEIDPVSQRIELEEALRMYDRNELQQSPEPKSKDKLRSLEFWPEAAIILAH